MERLRTIFLAIRPVAKRRRAARASLLTIALASGFSPALSVAAGATPVTLNAAVQAGGDAQDTTGGVAQDTTGGVAQDTTGAATVDTATVSPLAIQPGDIPRRAEETMVELREMQGRLQPEETLSALAAEVQDLLFLLDRKTAEFDQLQVDELSVRTLEDARQDWLSFRARLEGWQRRLERGAEAILGERARLREIDEIWLDTRLRAGDEDVPAALFVRTESVLATAESVLERVRFERDIVLTLQDELSQQVLDVRKVLTAIAEARETRFRGLLSPDAPPLWTMLRSQPEGPPPVVQVRRSFEEGIGQLRSYFSSSPARQAGWVQLGLLVGLLLLMAWLRHLSGAWPAEDPDLQASARILGRPMSSALLIALIFTGQFHPTAPLVLFDLNRLVLLVPVLRLLPKAAYSKLRAPVYVTAALYVLHVLRELALPDSLLQRLTLLAWSVVALIVLAWLARPGGSLTRLGPGMWSKAALIVARLGATAVAASVVVNLLGFVDLASYLAFATLTAAYAAIVLFAGYLVLEGAWRAVLRSRLASSLKSLRVYTPTAERRGLFLLRLIGAVVWLLFVLLALEASDTVIAAISAALSEELRIGSVGISVGNILAFAFTVWLAVIISGVIRALLAEDIFPRTKHARAADTISTVIYWALLLVGLLFAAAAAGFEIGRLTLLAGAFGVGIGFGLQDVVNNFVSGLILAFERPIQVGDIVELATVTGTVSRIGMRSSVIRTFEGAEIIVPNSNLVSNQMTNWTRSDRLRRVDVDVGVAYGTDQQEVFRVLMDVAKAHPDVLDHPGPNVLLRGFGDSSLDFTLRFWTQRFDGFARIQSEVTRAVLDALREADIHIPFPQRDLHVRSLDSTVKDAL
ncbi:MAG: mechanosensitive ion channel domain-containing protein, partial [Gemmatimonadota bacterium]